MLEVRFTKSLSVGTLGVTPGKVAGPHEGIFHFEILRAYSADEGRIFLREDYRIWRGLGKECGLFLFLSAAPGESQIELGSDWISSIVDTDGGEVIYQKPA